MTKSQALEVSAIARRIGWCDSRKMRTSARLIGCHFNRASSTIECMNYTIEHALNADVALIHIEIKLLPSLESWDGAKDWQTRHLRSDLAANLLSVPGVVKFSAEPYKFQVTKGRMFSWADVGPAFVAAIEEYLQRRGSESKEATADAPNHTVDLQA